MLTKILKNKTHDDIYLITMMIPADDQINLQTTMWAKVIQNGTIFELINIGSIVVNNGTVDLTVSQAIRHINLMQEESNNFSYRKINANTVVVVPLEQQMISYQEIDVSNTGELDIEGEVVIII